MPWRQQRGVITFNRLTCSVPLVAVAALHRAVVSLSGSALQLSVRGLSCAVKEPAVATCSWSCPKKCFFFLEGQC